MPKSPRKRPENFPSDTASFKKQSFPIALAFNIAARIAPPWTATLPLCSGRANLSTDASLLAPKLERLSAIPGLTSATLAPGVAVLGVCRETLWEWRDVVKY